MMMLQRSKDGRETLKENEVGNFCDQPKEDLRDKCADDAHWDRECNQKKHTRIGPKIAQQIVISLIYQGWKLGLGRHALQFAKEEQTSQHPSAESGINGAPWSATLRCRQIRALTQQPLDLLTKPFWPLPAISAT